MLLVQILEAQGNVLNSAMTLVRNKSIDRNLRMEVVAKSIEISILFELAFNTKKTYKLIKYILTPKNAKDI